ncbi:LytTR family DNA-binding domain-containing protein [Dyadobacter sp. 3J3]|uniref:LytR/AlgR family response regulator transcription factor n=1 Tax=Dyadobacter sp. 3J3 TaxID=2606600 RepID=UPI00135A4862|nr:LytTR family DNA-binding domain-containing protein [Dyadobacter sp. 3J3]
MKINCIAVDDEPLALGLISAFIKQTAFLDFKGHFSNAVQALNAIHSEDIQLVFLDIQMPELNGMELARVLSHTVSAPKVIFTTAYNQFAIEGYKVDALDYLLKPFGYDEFLRAANKAKNHFEGLMQNQPVPESQDEKYLFVKADYKLVRIDFDNILYIESLKDYIKIHLINSTHPVVSLSSLKAIEEKLPASRFMRIHRSFVVAIDKVDSITKSTVQLGATNISVGDQYKDAFKELLLRWG